jgi:acyl carrier protein
MKFPEFVKFVNKILKKKLNPKRNIYQQDVDSIDFTTLLLSIEEKFNMKFKSSAFNNLSTLEDIYFYIKKKK